MAEPRKTKANAGETRVAVKKSAARTPRARTIQPAEVAMRAYLISLSEPGASPEANWLRAEQELRAS